MLWFQLGEPSEAHADQRAGEEGGKGICSPASLHAGHGHYIPLHKAIDFISPSFFYYYYLFKETFKTFYFANHSQVKCVYVLCISELYT